MAFTWAQNYPDLQLLCRAFGMYEVEDPLRFKYKVLKGIIQEGPQCGLVALAMCTENPTKENVKQIFEHARSLNFTNNGEIFSTDYMYSLARKYLDNKLEIFEGSLNCKFIVEFLLDGGLLLVPYDCDRNHTPCFKQGHKAHWAVISGVIETECDHFVIAKHGKSLNLGIWNLNDLAKSNKQLNEFSPDRKQSDTVYILPDGGINGCKGLCGRSVMIYPPGNETSNII